LESVPSTISAAYADVITRIEKSPEQKELTMKVLSWVFYAKQPLKMNAILEALAIEDGDHCLQREYMLQPDDVIECCKSLIVHEISTDLVKFTHFTVQEFVQGIQNELLPPIVLAKTCLIYLAFDEFDESMLSTGAACASVIDRTNELEFGGYAAKFWADHVRGSPELSLDIQRYVVRVFGPERRRYSIEHIRRNMILPHERLLSPEQNYQLKILDFPCQSFIEFMAINELTKICKLYLEAWNQIK
jgi:hypothetical protein